MYRIPEYTEYQSVQSTKVYRIPECTEYQRVQCNRVYRVPECTEYQSVHSTRVYRVPECTEYQSVQSLRVYRIPECTEYQSTRMNRVPKWNSGQESDTEPYIKETRASGGNHPLTEFQLIMQEMEQMELHIRAKDAEMELFKKRYKHKKILQVCRQCWSRIKR